MSPQEAAVQAAKLEELKAQVRRRFRSAMAELENLLTALKQAANVCEPQGGADVKR